MIKKKEATRKKRAMVSGLHYWQMTSIKKLAIPH